MKREPTRGSISTVMLHIDRGRFYAIPRIGVKTMTDIQKQKIKHLRSVGKSYSENQIITIELDLTRDIKYRNPILIAEYIREKTADTSVEFYLFSSQSATSTILTPLY